MQYKNQEKADELAIEIYKIHTFQEMSVWNDVSTEKAAISISISLKVMQENMKNWSKYCYSSFNTCRIKKLET